MKFTYCAILLDVWEDKDYNKKFHLHFPEFKESGVFKIDSDTAIRDAAEEFIALKIYRAMIEHRLDELPAYVKTVGNNVYEVTVNTDSFEIVPNTRKSVKGRLY